MSDSHEQFANLSKAVEIANEKWCEHLLFAGDLISPLWVKVLGEFNWPVHFIRWNNEWEKTWFVRKFDVSDHMTLHGDICELELGWVKFFMNHYPRIGTLVAKSGEFDVVIYGHDHTYHQEMINDTLLVNPWAIMGNKEPASFMIFDTETRKVEKIVL